MKPGITPQKLFLKGNRYSPIYEAIEYPTGKYEGPNIKLILAQEVQQSKSEERRR